MRTKLVLMLAFVCGAAIASGCGGDDSRSGRYVDPYLDETRGRSGGASTAAAPMGGPSVAGGGSPKERVGDATAGGTYGDRKFEGDPLSGSGGSVSQADFQEFSSVGKDVTEATKLYTAYMRSKETSGTKDMGTLDRAIAMHEQMVPRVTALFDKYPNNREVSRYYQDIMLQLKNLGYEK